MVEKPALVSYKVTAAIRMSFVCSDFMFMSTYFATDFADEAEYVVAYNDQYMKCYVV